MEAVKNSMKEKVRYRQSAYAATINFENKSNLKYFYEGEHSSGKKDLITKVNSRIIEENRESSRKVVNSNIESEKKGQLSLDTSRTEVPPSFNSFNFHRMLRTKLNKINPGSDSEEEEVPRSRGKKREDASQESILINNSHTWRMVKDKVQK